ncbi:MAG: division/cell wall cluster transcriptional repressor MraZ [Rhizomicrobium sp.]|jgi:MraZ protein
MSLQVQPFISTVPGTLDSKGRVCIPAPYRQILAAQNTPGVYICPSVFEAALEGFGQTLLDAVHERFAKLDPLFSQEYDDEATTSSPKMRLLLFDEQGRVRLPDEMIAHAGLKDQVVFVGMVQKFQIWDPQRFAPVEAARIARVRAKRELELARRSGGGA